MNNRQKRKVGKNRARAIAFIAVLVLVIGVSAFMASGLGSCSPDNAGNQEFEAARVVRVVDGDTLIVNRGGGNERVRLIGINAPESVHQNPDMNTPEGVAASDFVKSIVKPGQVVYMQKDLSDRDQYNRLLRYIWLELPTDPQNTEEVRTKMLNGILVDTGHAEARVYKPDTAYNQIFDSIAAQ